MEKYCLYIAISFFATVQELRRRIILSFRWAIKQEDLSNIGQWKFSTVSNPEWNKRALSWPVTEDGTWNEVQ